MRRSERHVRVLPCKSEDLSLAIDRVVLTAEDLLRERALRAAVLIDAVRCLLGLAGDREQRMALRWVVIRDEAPVSFGNVCETLGLSPRLVRRMMLDPAHRLDTETFTTSLRYRPHPVRYVVQRARTGT